MFKVMILSMLLFIMGCGLKTDIDMKVESPLCTKKVQEKSLLYIEQQYRCASH